MTSLLRQSLEENPSETLWIADENSKALLQQDLHFAGDLLSNRWDIAQLARDCAANVFFKDFDLDALPKKYARIVFPVSKEKAVVHHIINRAPNILLPLGELILLGQKNSGIKTYAGKAAQYFGTGKNLQKDGSDYLSTTALPDHPIAGAALDDSHYPKLRQPDALDGLFSKPGLFGWNKVDIGSVLLATQFAGQLPKSGAKIVDLGCGYGYLTLQMASLGDFHFTATDNNAAALLACAENFRAGRIRGEVLPSDAGSEVTANSADLVICNPPFHQGFQVEGDLTERFLKNSARVLAADGYALFVVNEFIPLQKKAQPYFARAERLTWEKGFCVYRLEKS